MSRGMRLVTILAVLALGTIVALALRDYFTVDACLDSGGRWNDELRNCER
jgi:type II secretory pathway component PulK